MASRRSPAGTAVYAALHLLTRGSLFAALAGTSVAAGYAGFNFGRRDSRELARFSDLGKSRNVRREAVVHTGRAVWRGIAEGTGGAAAVIIVNLRPHGFAVHWLLPLVPAVVARVLSAFHAAVALPPAVPTFKHGKPPMPLSAALAARADLAHVADALGHESLTESHQHSS